MQDGLFVCGTGLKQEVEVAKEQVKWRTNKKKKGKEGLKGYTLKLNGTWISWTKPE